MLLARKGDIDQVRRSIVADSREAIERVLALEQDRSRALVLRVSDVDLIEAVKIAVAGEKPSRGKGEWGLLQDDCLIVAALERFMRGHAEDRIVLCSGNTSDFAEGPKGSRGLHHDIAGRFRDAVYFENPVECIQLLEADLGETGRAELAQLGEAYERVSAARVPEGLLVMANVIEHISEAMEKERQAFEENRGIVAGLMAFAQPRTRVGCLCPRRPVRTWAQKGFNASGIPRAGRGWQGQSKNGCGGVTGAQHRYYFQESWYVAE